LYFDTRNAQPALYLDGKKCAPACASLQRGRLPLLAPHDARFQLGQGQRRDSFLAKVSGPCPDAAPDASVGAGSGNCPARQAGSFAGTAHRAVPKRSALHIAGPLAQISKFETVSPRALFNMFHLDKIVTVLIPGLAPRSIDNLPCRRHQNVTFIKVGSPAFYRDLAIARLKYLC